MPTASRASTSVVSADNIIEGSRKRAKLDTDGGTSLAQSPGTSTSRLPEGSSGAHTEGGPEIATSLGFKLLDVLINRIDEDNQPLTVPFLALPSKSDYPDYYEMIKNPVSLEQIRRRLQNREYESFEQVRNAFESICRNAKRYNQKGSEIYEKSRTMHQIILHAFIDLVEKGDVQPIGGFILQSDPPLQEQSARLAKLEKPSRRARLDYDEVDEGEIEGRVSLRLKKDDDIPYEEDGEVGNDETMTTRQMTEEKSIDDSSERQIPVPIASSVPPRAKEERRTPQIGRSMDPDETDEGNMSTSHIFEDGDIEMLDGRPIDRSMLTLAGKFDRRKRPGPRGKRLKSTLRNLVVELMAAVDQQGQLITRFFRTLPSRLQYPDYYKVIQRPIALDSIEDKVHKKGYANPYALIVELRQMVDNAQYYNEEGSEVWEAAEQVRQYVEGSTIPTLLADGFTIDPKDMRQSALPVEIAANSSVPAQAAAFRIQMERRKALENGPSNEYMDSVSPEIPSRALGPASYDKLKVRLHPRGSNHAGPASMSDMQPPPPSVALGLSVNDPSSQLMAPRGPYGQALPSQGIYSPAMPGPAPSASPYGSGMGQPHSSPPMAAHAWHNGSPAAPGNLYPGQYGYSTTPQMGTRPPSTMMPPPVTPNYTNGSLPFQKPTAVQILGTPGQPSLVEGEAGKISPNLSKRLPGEAPPFDSFRTNVMRVDENNLIVRQALISSFGLRVRGKDGIKADSSYFFRNDVTRIHSVSVLSQPPELLQCQVQLMPHKRPRRENEATEEVEEKPWTVSIHHNGKGIRPHWEGQNTNGTSAEEAATATTINGSASTPTSTRVQIPPGTPCRFDFTPLPGANVLSINIHPPPFHPGLLEIVKDDKHPLRSKAKQLLELPEKYRLLIYCQS